MTKMLIHIGYHKTATSWLQDIYFPAHPELADWPQKSKLRRMLIEPHSLDFDPVAVREKLTPFISEAAREKKRPLLSAEGLCGSPHNGGVLNKELADRLHALFPDAKILAVIRRQPEMIASAYRQYIRAGGVCQFDDYVNPPVKDAKLPLFRLENYMYHKLLKYYAELFGHENVGVLIYEEFCQEPETFLNKLCAHFEVSPLPSPPVQERVNAAPSTDTTLPWRRALNLMYGGVTFNPVAQRFPALCEVLKNRIKSFERQKRHPKRLSVIDKKALSVSENLYRASNRQLQDLFHLDMEKYDYQV